MASPPSLCKLRQLPPHDASTTPSPQTSHAINQVWSNASCHRRGTTTPPFSLTPLPSCLKPLLPSMRLPPLQPHDKPPSLSRHGRLPHTLSPSLLAPSPQRLMRSLRSCRPFPPLPFFMAWPQRRHARREASHRSRAHPHSIAAILLSHPLSLATPYRSHGDAIAVKQRHRCPVPGHVRSQYHMWTPLYGAPMPHRHHLL